MFGPGIDVDDIDHVDAVRLEQTPDLLTELERRQVPGEAEGLLGEGVATEQFRQVVAAQQPDDDVALAQPGMREPPAPYLLRRHFQA